LAVGLATFLVCLAIAARPLRTYTATISVALPEDSAQAPDADHDGLAADSSTLAAQLSASIRDDAALAEAAEAAGLRASGSGATALLSLLRSVLEVAPVPAATGRPAAATLTARAPDRAEAQALALAVAEGFARAYQQRAGARGELAVSEARQAVAAAADKAQQSQAALDEFLSRHFADAASAPAPAPPPAAAPREDPPKPAEPAAAPIEGESISAEARSAEAELQRLKQRRRQLLTRFTKFHYAVQEVDMHIARVERELAILAPHRAALPAPRNDAAPAAPADTAEERQPPGEAAAPGPKDSQPVDTLAEQQAARAAAAATENRLRLTSDFDDLRRAAGSAREAALQATVQERAALEHQAQLARQGVLRISPPVVDRQTTSGLDQRGVGWSILWATTLGGLAFCLTGPRRQVYRTPAEVEDDLGLPLVSALASRSAAAPRRASVLPAFAARLTACGELALLAIACGLAVLAWCEPGFRSQLIESPLSAYAEAAGRLLGR
jgi:hypothetical protein